MRNGFPKRLSGAPLHHFSKLYEVPFRYITSTLLAKVLIHCRLPKVGCYLTSDYLSYSCKQPFAKSCTGPCYERRIFKFISNFRKFSHVELWWYFRHWWNISMKFVKSNPFCFHPATLNIVHTLSRKKSRMTKNDQNKSEKQVFLLKGSGHEIVYALSICNYIKTINLKALLNCKEYVTIFRNI